MRIIAGQHRGRRLKTPDSQDIRPTSDKVRQAVFNMLGSRGLVNDTVVMDVFCGTGALGIEALSQGASFCYCLLYTSPSPRDQRGSRMPSSA